MSLKSLLPVLPISFAAVWLCHVVTSPFQAPHVVSICMPIVCGSTLLTAAAKDLVAASSGRQVIASSILHRCIVFVLAIASLSAWIVGTSILDAGTASAIGESIPFMVWILIESASVLLALSIAIALSRLQRPVYATEG